MLLRWDSNPHFLPTLSRHRITRKPTSQYPKSSEFDSIQCLTQFCVWAKYKLYSLSSMQMTKHFLQLSSGIPGNLSTILSTICWLGLPRPSTRSMLTLFALSLPQLGCLLLFTIIRNSLLRFIWPRFQRLTCNNTKKYYFLLYRY